MCVCVCVCVYWQHFFVITIFFKHSRHFMSTYFLLDPLEFSYYFYRFRGGLIYVLSIVLFTLVLSAAHKYNSTLEYRRLTDPPLMMSQSRAESTRFAYNYGQHINQFPPNMIKVIREFERIQKNICRHVYYV